MPLSECYCFWPAAPLFVVEFTGHLLAAGCGQWAAAVRPYTVPREVACTYSANHSYAVGLPDLAGTGWLHRLATGAAAAASSDDLVLQAMGREAMRALVTAEPGRNQRANRAISNYCVIVRAALEHHPSG
ncbi:hypothetical protein [Allorhizocola rhizosphaerae]|uniref:hypothetical protein n=1 Tax=Allorhizocola rhizosphaerae TaxID=1872709 RepID=UPI000E3C3955|nr:hypothetical protein [Allorhizocola rhizosphaerae]